MGGTTTGGTTTGGTGGVADTTRPTIVSVSPANGATGVRANANIVVTFSEPMDPVRRLRTAYQSADIPNAGVTFGWSADDTVLTIDPNSDLLYARRN